MKEIRWGIIGCGNVTEQKSGPAFNKVPHSRLVAVMRRDAAKAKDYAERHQVPRWYSDAAQLIADPEVNAIYIATPPVYHEAYAMAALQQGKPVYLEKPMTLHAAEAARIRDAAAKSGIPISVAHYRRQQPYFLKIKELIDSGAIGKPLLAQMELLQPYRSSMLGGSERPWRVDPSISGGGLFHDLAPHQLDLMVYFFGNWKKASGYAVNQGGLYEADDAATGTIVFQNDVLFSGSWGFTVPPEAKKDACVVTGSKGSIRFGIFDQQPVTLQVGERVTHFPFDPLQHVQQPMIAAVVQYFRGEGPNPCTAEEGHSVMQLMDAFTKK